MFSFETRTGFKIEIPKEFNGYKFLEFLSNGAFSAVAKVEETATGEFYAAKIISIRDMEERNHMKTISNEIEILRSLDHPNVIKLFETFFVENEDNDLFLIIITEYCSNGDLVQFISREGFKDENEKRDIEFQILEAVEYLHRNGIAHCDLKPDNILLDENMTPKLCDFGLSKDIYGENEGIMDGALQYSSPELFEDGTVDYLKADVFAIGITFYVITELKLPYVGGTTIKKGKLEIASYDDEINEFVRRCTIADPEERPTIGELLDDGFFASYQNEEEEDFVDCGENSVIGEIAIEDENADFSGNEIMVIDDGFIDINGIDEISEIPDVVINCENLMV